MENDPIVLTLYEKFKGFVTGEEKINAVNIVIIVQTLIPTIEKMVKGDGRGEYKKEVLIMVLNKIIQDAELEPEVQAFLEHIVETSIPPMIDTMISIAHGEIDLGKEFKKARDDCKVGCFSCIKK